VEAAMDKGWGLAALSHAFGPEAATHVALRGVRVYKGSDVDRGAVTQMPLSANDLMARGMEPGPDMGKALAGAKAYWYSTDLRADKESLLVAAADEVENG